MAAIEENTGNNPQAEKKARRNKKSATRVDMTPMVDLAFLLLTFFVLTSTFSKPKVMSLVYPAKQIEGTQTPTNNAITFLLTENRVFYYAGQYYPAGNERGKAPTVLQETDFSTNGVRKLLADYNSYVLEEKEMLQAKLESKEIRDDVYLKLLMNAKKDHQALKVLVKTDSKTTCRNFVDLIDELKIAEIGMIAPVDILASELALIDGKLQEKQQQTKTAAL
jgi:biopolymer transport protein ExbD